jgi:CheY-like chemotaxis protein
MDELIPILEDDPAAAPHIGPEHRTWRVLVVDDDPEVLIATRLALQGVELLGRELELIMATSAREARERLQQTSGIAAILLDVVMETTDAGLQLVKVIREEMGLKELRIILRTGEPGYAPEISVISNYDINDYKTKSELTQTRLLTALTAALRSYGYITVINSHRRGLEKIVRASAALLERQSLLEFAEGVLTQIAAVLQLPLDGLLCAQRGSPLEQGSKDGPLYVLGAAGALAGYIARPIEDLDRPEILRVIRKAMGGQRHVFTETCTVLYLRNRTREGAIYRH